MKRKSVLAGLAIAGLAATGIIAVGGSAFADGTASASPSATASQKSRPGGGQSQDTAVTGDEAQKVIDAVQTKNSGVTITTARKDPDGTYDALGTTADGTQVMYDVSTDLATITQASDKLGR